MRKILGTTLVAMVLVSGVMANTISSENSPKQIEENHNFSSFVDMQKVTSCPQYTKVVSYKNVNSHDEVVSIEVNGNETIPKVKTFKDGLSVLISACVDKGGDLRLKINNTFYKTIKE